MEIRKVQHFNGSLGITLPKQYAQKLALQKTDLVEIYFVDPNKIVVQKHPKSREGGIGYV